MEKYQISADMHNFCRTFDEDLTKPQMDRFKELMHGIIRGQKGILSEISRRYHQGIPQGYGNDWYDMERKRGCSRERLLDG